MSNQFFIEHMPYCVELKGDQLVVKNRDYKVIFIGKAPFELDLKRTLHFAAANGKDCFRERKDTLQCYLYDTNSDPSENTFHPTNMSEYLSRLEVLLKILAQVEPISSIRETPSDIRYVLDLAKMKMDEAEDHFEDFLHKNYDYVEAHGDRHYEQVFFKNMPLVEGYTISMNLIGKHVDSFDIIGPFDLAEPPQN